MTRIALIVAVAHNNVIGLGNTLPWHCPADLQYFKRTTMGAPVIMGRKTYESLKIKPLPGRQNIVITRDKDFHCEGCDTAASIETALQLNRNAERVFIIGGEEIYKQTLDCADELYITYVDADVQGDRYFPSISLGEWQLVKEENFLTDEKNPYDLRFTRLVRK